ncbi:hypothetical protein Y032_0015g2618 [Ancylostoma ceylanicum]|uniref:Uncharacterized protein n=1 Tax=Ancylostoma ceylanicum TaxID=53326 RepID=A0A016V9G3_9BILA|nr:hypothetical protein Y032_0015g2618 [Ancylostoma ceylanicum]
MAARRNDTCYLCCIVSGNLSGAQPHNLFFLIFLGLLCLVESTVYSSRKLEEIKAQKTRIEKSNNSMVECYENTSFQLNKDRTAFVRQLEASNPESRLEAQYAPTIDFTKHVKNLSVRYVSTILPTENNLDDWIVLPLFQHGQDIPIDNDGRTAILVAHAPSLERLLEMWRERIDGERHDRREKKRHRKSERRECRHQKRAEKRKRKETEESDTKPKLSKHEDDEKEPHLSGIEVENIIVPAADSPAKNSTSTVVSVRDNESDCKGCEGLPNTNVKTIEHVLHREAKVDNKLTRDCMGQIKTCSQSASKQHINLAERQVDSKQEYSSLTEVTVNASAGKSIQNCGRALKQRDPTVTRDASTIEDSEGIMAMENQIATIEAAELAQDVKVVESAVCEIHLESDHAALNLERELNGEHIFVIIHGIFLFSMFMHLFHK